MCDDTAMTQNNPRTLLDWIASVMQLFKSQVCYSSECYDLVVRAIEYSEALAVDDVMDRYQVIPRTIQLDKHGVAMETSECHKLVQSTR
ncbi:Hypothetical protein MVR_LOCUS110 [uncultured virus]|nr:Hypothetical protein MVR_LOCUS110 [uncultured virus]